jgi:hypothetical protein
LPGSIVHVLSLTKPSVRIEAGKVLGVDLEPIENTEHGDTIGFLDWPATLAVTWRFAPIETAPENAATLQKRTLAMQRSRTIATSRASTRRKH